MQRGCIRAKLLYFGKSCCIRAKMLYSGKMSVFGKIRCIPAKVVVLEQKWLYSGKEVVFL